MNYDCISSAVALVVALIALIGVIWQVHAQRQMQIGNHRTEWVRGLRDALTSFLSSAALYRDCTKSDDDSISRKNYLRELIRKSEAEVKLYINSDAQSFS